ncbi:glycine--tRNA ligase subunit beta [Aestuariivita sp.]|jgi:glycyl-tRNA synthetase beta chain|uniref:glycine--tRNA ligase subunit beta n=1 Tax=Aestuariivita sp. TaxID=1872407 RepID=UPI00216BFCD2|nr:glycine--tRNA ligase subunit beta [Aestuariivita sp.]MCE8006809.1 glycine--tRNA ligase subunit beta [Aestuariivita sp.]
MPQLLIELFSEEIPARMQVRAAADLKTRVTNGLVEAGLTYAGAESFCTPRRLVLVVDGVLDASPTLREERKGPKVGAPDKAVEGFLRGAGLTRADLEERETPKGAVFFAMIEKPGRPAAEIVAEVLTDVIRQFPWPKSMRWGTGALRWVRPLQSILCILSDDAGPSPVPLEIDGMVAGDTTEGHRFMAPGRFSVSNFEDYTAKLKRAFVLLSAQERAQHIWADATNMAFSAGLEMVEDKGLLAEVAGLVEWPVVLMGEIGAEFLELPPEVLQTSMREHQKFFSVRNPKSGRIEKFVTVANRETADHGATILAGNQKVLSARLADAKFFWENDLRTIKTVGLEGMAGPLSEVTFHNKLGSQKARVTRIEALARHLAPMVGAKPDLAAEAARVCKADLASEMVYEFPELQGVMGRYYAVAAGHDDGVPEACEAHYSPLGPSDDVPTAPVSVAVALADKIDILTGFWAIDEKPTGSKDPFALRRAALGVIRLVLENDLRLDLASAVRKADILVAENADGIVGPSASGYIHDLLSFIHDRLKVYLRDQGIRHDVIDASLAMPGNDDLTLLVTRARALSETLATDDGENLIQGFKRANNLLTQAEEADGVEYSFGPDPKFADTQSERSLFAALDRAEAVIAPAMEAEDFAQAMAAMADLRGPIDAFFEDVKVNDENQTLRRNRLNMLHRIRGLCLEVADLTKIEG